MVGDANERKENVEFVPTTVPWSSSKPKRWDIIRKRTLQSIVKGEEIFVKYGTLYQVVLKKRPWEI